MTTSLRQRVLDRLGQGRNEFASWKPHLQELAQHLAPRRARWSLSEYNRGDKINGTVINNTPLLAARVFSSGFMAAVSNPLLQWFRLTPPDPELGEHPAVKAYLHLAQERLRWAFQMGSFYQGLADGIYPDLGVFGFSCGLLEDDPERVLRLTVLPIGEYFLAANAQGEIDALTRELPMTVRQFVGEFVAQPGGSLDWSRASRAVKALWDGGQYGTVVPVVHAVLPNIELERGAAGARGKPFSSVWVEEAGDRDEVMREGGYEEFPALCPRWSVRGAETYGRSEAMNILGDCKQLQHHERRLATLIDLAARPPMVADESLRGNRLSLVPGDVMYAPRGQGEAYRPALQVNPQAIVALLDHIRRAEDRIEEGMFTRVFAKLLSDERNQRATATEIEQIAREVASQVGPGLLRMDGELFRPAIDRAFAVLERRGYLPIPPPELQGVDVKPEFISPMHQSQKGVELQPLRVFLGEVAALSQVAGPSVVDKLAADKLVTELANVTGIKPDLVLSDEEVQAIRAQRAARQQAMEQGQAMLAAAKGAKDLGTTPAPAQDNALGAVLGALSPEQATGAVRAPFGPVVGGLA